MTKIIALNLTCLSFNLFKIFFCYATNGHIIPLSLPTVSPKSALQAFKTTKNAQSPTLLMLKQLQAVIAN